MSNEEFNEGFRKRTKTFAAAIINFCDDLPSLPSMKIVTYQLCKSSTSTGANFRAFCRGRSKNEKYAKIMHHCRRSRRDGLLVRINPGIWQRHFS